MGVLLLYRRAAALDATLGQEYAPLKVDWNGVASPVRRLESREKVTVQTNVLPKWSCFGQDSCRGVDTA